MSLRSISIFVLVVFASLGATSRSEAVPLVSLDPSNLGIGTLGTAFDPVTNTITITEDWTSALMGSPPDIGARYRGELHSRQGNHEQ